MPQKLIIELSEKGTVKYLAYATGKTEAEVNDDCEPSGLLLVLISLQSLMIVVYMRKIMGGLLNSVKQK